MKGYVVSKGLDGTEAAYRPKKISHYNTYESFKTPKLPYRNREGQNRGVFGATGDMRVTKQNKLKSPHRLGAYGSKVKNPITDIQLMSK